VRKDIKNLIKLNIEKVEELERFFEGQDEVLVAYVFGSHARGTHVLESDVDVAVFLSKLPKDLLNYVLELISKLTDILGDKVDLIILNIAPPTLKYQVIKHGKIIYCRNETARVLFESRSVDEYLDFKRILERYDKCLIKKLLT